MELKSVLHETRDAVQTPDTSRSFVVCEQNQDSIRMSETLKQKKLYRIFFLLGIGALLPFNCIIVPVDFWLMFYNPIFLSAAALSYNAGNWIVTLYMMINGYKHNKNTIMTTALTTWLVSLIIIPVLHPIIQDVLLKTIITLIPIVCCGMANGLYFPIVLDMGCKLGPLNAQAMMAGNGIAGLVTQFLLILIKGIVTGAKVSQDQYNKTLFYQTLIYFILGAGYIVFCFFVWAKLKPTINKYDMSNQNNSNEDQKEEKSSFVQVFKMIIVPSLSIFSIFAITLAWPLLSSPRSRFFNAKRLPPCGNGWWNISVMTTFMIFDWVGGQMPGLQVGERLFELEGVPCVSRCPDSCSSPSSCQALHQYVLQAATAAQRARSQSRTCQVTFRSRLRAVKRLHLFRHHDEVLFLSPENQGDKSRPTSRPSYSAAVFRRAVSQSGLQFRFRSDSECKILLFFVNISTLIVKIMLLVTFKFNKQVEQIKFCKR
ncbi:Nucleoside_transporter [Hexamita inflata]|uniref:Nucleoside transporter n=1 Tax=Hexamita inflata TaxID=28002 RepID=A0AA86P846_9EUKA|nr:Nucleoside transporter [Hexamita inflata]